jgi:hypothetical protein
MHLSGSHREQEMTGLTVGDPRSLLIRIILHHINIRQAAEIALSDPDLTFPAHRDRRRRRADVTAHHNIYASAHWVMYKPGSEVIAIVTISFLWDPTAVTTP